MYKIDTCLCYNYAVPKLGVCENLIKPYRPQAPDSKAWPVLETTLCRPMPLPTSPATMM